jgi:hypothetical protein
MCLLAELFDYLKSGGFCGAWSFPGSIAFRVILL